uniref:Uncharacterized protein n=1 Tax=Rangifer tarandus platyrhynchus TaxID=3082113 RepID=A0ACB0EIB3_RANTA|nr:unnamed protein product [Rangifer tarandus platyrhynchus]
MQDPEAWRLGSELAEEWFQSLGEHEVSPMGQILSDVLTAIPVPGTQEASVASVATGTYLIEDISPGTVAS